MKISIDITDTLATTLQAAARRLNVSAEELASAVVGELLTQGEAEFDQVAQRILEKNRELYRRLA